MKSNKAMKVAAELSQFIASASTPFRPSNTLSSPPSASPQLSIHQNVPLNNMSDGTRRDSQSSLPVPLSMHISSSSPDVLFNENGTDAQMSNRPSSPMDTTYSSNNTINNTNSSNSSSSSSNSGDYMEEFEKSKSNPSFLSTMLGVNRTTANFIQGDKGLPYPVSRYEDKRVDALNSLHIMDSDANDASFDNITRLTSLLLNCPVSLVTLVTKDAVWTKSRAGLPDPSLTPRHHSLCTYVVVDDAADIVQVHPLRDPILSTIPAVTAMPIGFYAGCSLVIAGQKVGTLCVVDNKERPYLDPREEHILRSLAAVVVDLLLLHQRRAQEALRAQSFAKERSVLLQTLGSMTTGAFIVDRTSADYRVIYANSGACKIFGCNEDQLLNNPLENIVKGQKTNSNDFEKLRSTIQFARSGTVMMQSDRINKYAAANISAGPPISFWAKYVVTQLGPEDNLFGASVASLSNKKSGAGGMDDSLQLGAYCFVEVSNEDRLAQASLEVEKTKEEAIIALDSRRVLMINLAREIRSKLDLVVQAGSLMLSSSIDNNSTADNGNLQGNEQSKNEITQLARVVVENGLYLTSLTNTMAAHEMAQTQEGKKRSQEENDVMDAEKKRRMQM